MFIYLARSPIIIIEILFYRVFHLKKEKKKGEVGPSLSQPQIDDHCGDNVQRTMFYTGSNPDKRRGREGEKEIWELP